MLDHASAAALMPMMLRRYLMPPFTPMA